MTGWPPCDTEGIRKAVEAAERMTSAELRVHIARTCSGDPRDKATRIFASLGMHKTAARNGVLIYVAPASRKWAVLGDGGFQSRVTELFWSELAEGATTSFQSGDFTGGIVGVIATCAQELSIHFPVEPGDRNELPDHVSVE